MWQLTVRRLRRFLSPFRPRRLEAWLRARVDAVRLAWAQWQEYGERWAKTLAWFREIQATIQKRRRDTRLTVAVDVNALWEPLTGIGWYLYRLLEHLAEREDLRLRCYGPQLISTPDLAPPQIELPHGCAIEVVRYPVPADLAFPYDRLVHWLRRHQDWLIAADRNRLLFAPNYFLPPTFGRARGKLIATVHDLSFERVPLTMQEETRNNLATHLAATVERAVRVLTDSEAVRAELVEGGLVAADVVQAIHLGPGPTANAPIGVLPSGTPKRYGLHVGTLEPRKNIALLLTVWEELQHQSPDPPALVLCGRWGWKSEELQALVAAHAPAGWLFHFGYLPKEQVAALYQQALVVVIPSLYEGFGLPAVEAMHFGIPLVCSDLPVLREVAGDAALFAPADDRAAWLAQLSRFLREPELRRELSARSAARKPLFDWRKTAAQTAATWQAASESPP